MLDTPSWQNSNCTEHVQGAMLFDHPVVKDFLLILNIAISIIDQYASRNFFVEFWIAEYSEFIHGSCRLIRVNWNQLATRIMTQLSTEIRQRSCNAVFSCRPIFLRLTTGSHGSSHCLLCDCHGWERHGLVSVPFRLHLAFSAKKPNSWMWKFARQKLRWVS